MVLSPAGLVIESWWGSIPAFFPDVVLDAMIVMPNHLHGLLMLEGGAEPAATTLSLSKLMEWFKSHTTNDYIRGVKLGGWPKFQGRLWQPRFYDHIVRNDRALEQIRSYIAATPSKWPEDRYNDAESSRSLTTRL